MKSAAKNNYNATLLSTIYYNTKIILTFVIQVMLVIVSKIKLKIFRKRKSSQYRNIILF